MGPYPPTSSASGDEEAEWRCEELMARQRAPGSLKSAGAHGLTQNQFAQARASRLAGSPRSSGASWLPSTPSPAILQQLVVMLSGVAA
jgi:hypothetical protein